MTGPWENVDAVAPYTNFGRSAIDVAGPGGTGTPGQPTTVWLVCSQVTQVTTAPQRPCRTGDRLIWSSTGTSFGAAATSGLAALLVSTMGKGRPEQIEAAIRHSADDLGDPGTDPYYGEDEATSAARWPACGLKVHEHLTPRRAGGLRQPVRGVRAQREPRDAALSSALGRSPQHDSSGILRFEVPIERPTSWSGTGSSAVPPMPYRVVLPFTGVR